MKSQLPFTAFVTLYPRNVACLAAKENGYCADARLNVAIIRGTGAQQSISSYIQLQW